MHEAKLEVIIVVYMYVPLSMYVQEKQKTNRPSAQLHNSDNTCVNMVAPTQKHGTYRVSHRISAGGGGGNFS